MRAGVQEESKESITKTQDKEATIAEAGAEALVIARVASSLLSPSHSRLWRDYESIHIKRDTLAILTSDWSGP
eukprot:990-Heterococcus_DN1.PRE.4